MDKNRAPGGLTHNKMAANVGHQKMAGNHQLTSNMLLQQIQTLSDLQNSGTVHHADPAAQVGRVLPSLPKRPFLVFAFRPFISILFFLLPSCRCS
jgi:hypothetical protein